MKIIVYSHRDDPYSDMLKNLLRYYNVSYENIEISRNNQAFLDMKKISGQTTTPVLVVDDKAFAGFDRQKIKEILNLPPDTHP
jgi:glutaredoxin